MGEYDEFYSDNNEDFIINNRDLKNIGVYLVDFNKIYATPCFENVYMCPYGLDETCEGFKDKEYINRCCGADFKYAECPLYKYFSQQINMSQLIEMTGFESFLEDCKKAIYGL